MITFGPHGQLSRTGVTLAHMITFGSHDPLRAPAPFRGRGAPERV